jgi:hypothetical protein
MITIRGNSRCIFKAASWLRKRSSTPPGERLDDEFAQYFNCRVVRNSLLDFHIEFDNDAEATMFSLRWS